MNLSETTKKRLAGLLPQGYDADLARFMVVAAQLQAVSELSEEDQQIVAAAKEQGITAGGPEPITDGRPTLMRVVAWMCHEGVNRNGDAFVREELPGAAAKVSARNPLVMDWNHAGILGGEGRVIGVWTKLDYAFDKAARDGQGAWGIIAEGVMFAWAFPEIADVMMAEQQRHNKIDFSMACIPSSVEFGEMEGKRCAILHNPIFFTLSALDVAPGDKDAVGLAVEGENREGIEQELRQELMSAALTAANGVATLTTTSGATFSFALKTEDPAPLIRTESMSITLSFTVARNENGELELVALAKDAEGNEVAQETFSATAEGFKQMQEALTASQEQAVAMTAKVGELETLIEASKISYQTLEAQVAELSTKITELETNLAAKVTELETANARLAEIDAAKAEADRVALLNQRLAQLPEAYLEAHGKREEAKRAELETEWSKMSEEAWTAKLEDISLALPKGNTRIASYLERSKREGLLPAGVSADADATSIADRVHKFTRNSR